LHRGTQTDVTSASVTTSPPTIIPTTSIKGFTYEPPKQERIDDDDEDDDYDEDGNFVEEEAHAYGRKNVGPVTSP